MKSPPAFLLLATLTLAVIIGIFSLSPIPQSPAYHAFCDTRRFWGIPNTANVLSNLPFLAIGLWGLRWLHWLDRAHEDVLDAMPVPQSMVCPPVNALDCAWMFFAGLVLTAASRLIKTMVIGSRSNTSPSLSGER